MKKVLTAFILSFSLLLSINAQTTSVTYQGRLNDGAAPANGVYEMQFKLFDNPNSGQGTQQGATVTNSSVAVAGGVFAVVLDFGAAPFASGANLFLEVGVRPAGNPGAYTTLAPRQKLNSVPYAVKSNSAGSADALSNACTGCIQNAQINSLDGNKVTGTVANAANANQLGGLPTQRFVKYEESGAVLIGTSTPTTSTLAVGGVIESTSGGLKFPDGSEQTSAGLTAVTTDSTLAGDGTNAAPLGVSSPLATRDLDNPARQPFSVGGFSTHGGTLVTVPAGKTLVVEFVVCTQFHSSLAGNPNPEISFSWTTGNFSIYPTNFFNVPFGYYFNLNQPVKVYIPENSVVKVFFTSLPSFKNLFVSGYFFDNPTSLTNRRGKN
ncbi:MAG: hypothetical protein JSS81_15455 [Acidobacteria bacterium]|nr:hypothetical protein [Acidobacteriota bacterium]